jgi:hypothetical protein
VETNKAPLGGAAVAVPDAETDAAADAEAVLALDAEANGAPDATLEAVAALVVLGRAANE